LVYVSHSHHRWWNTWFLCTVHPWPSVPQLLPLFIISIYHGVEAFHHLCFCDLWSTTSNLSLNNKVPKIVTVQHLFPCMQRSLPTFCKSLWQSEIPICSTAAYTPKKFQNIFHTRMKSCSLFSLIELFRDSVQLRIREACNNNTQ